MNDPILFVESTKAEAHPKMDFVAVEFKSGNQYISLCLPLELAKKFLAEFTEVVRVSVKNKKDRDVDLETTPGTAD